MSYIESQDTFEGLGLGNYPASYNACAPIAFFNLMEFFNTEIPYEIIRRIFDCIVYFKGKFGIFPWQMNKILKEFSDIFESKVCITKLISSKYYRWTKSNNYKNNIACAIIMYWCGGGFHYAFIDNYGILHNSYGKNLEDLEKELKIPSVLFKIKVLNNNNN